MSCPKGLLGCCLRISLGTALLVGPTLGLALIVLQTSLFIVPCVALEEMQLTPGCTKLMAAALLDVTLARGTSLAVNGYVHASGPGSNARSTEP